MMIKVFWILIVVIFALSSCNPATSVNVYGITPSFSEVTDTTNPTSMVEIHTNTPAPSVTPSPYPTLNPSKSAELINQLIISDEICPFPCWGGIVPGKTNWNEAYSYFESFAKIIKHSPSQPKGYTILIMTENPPSDQEAWFATVYLDEKNIVKFIEGNRKKIPVDQLLNKFGEPDEINLFILGVLPSDNVEKFRLLFSYKEQGFSMIYDGETLNQPLLDICPLLFKDDPGFWLWNPEDASAFMTITEDKLYSPFWDYWSQYQEISIATMGKVTKDSFYRTYSDPANINNCIQVSSPYAEEINAP